jgi:hypothetical protein
LYTDFAVPFPAAFESAFASLAWTKRRANVETAMPTAAPIKFPVINIDVRVVAGLDDARLNACAAGGAASSLHHRNLLQADLVAFSRGATSVRSWPSQGANRES